MAGSPALFLAITLLWLVAQGPYYWAEPTLPATCLQYSPLPRYPNFTGVPHTSLVCISPQIRLCESTQELSRVSGHLVYTSLACCRRQHNKSPTPLKRPCPIGQKLHCTLECDHWPVVSTHTSKTPIKSVHCYPFISGSCTLAHSRCARCSSVSSPG